MVNPSDPRRSRLLSATRVRSLVLAASTLAGVWLSYAAFASVNAPVKGAPPKANLAPIASSCASCSVAPKAKALASDVDVDSGSYTKNGVTVTWTRNGEGRLATVTKPDRSYRLAYNAQGGLDRVYQTYGSSSETEAMRYEYHANGNVHRVWYAAESRYIFGSELEDMMGGGGTAMALAPSHPLEGGQKTPQECADDHATDVGRCATANALCKTGVIGAMMGGIVACAGTGPLMPPCEAAVFVVYMAGMLGCDHVAEQCMDDAQEKFDECINPTVYCHWCGTNMNNYCICWHCGWERPGGCE